MANLIARYRLDDNAADTVVVEDVGTVGNATLVGGENTQDVVTAGTYGYGFYLDGNDYVDCGNNSALALGTISIVADVRFDSLSGWQAIASRYELQGYQLAINNPHFGGGLVGFLHWTCYIGGAARHVKWATSNLTTGVTYRVVGTYDGVDMNLYVDGVLVDTLPIAGSISNPTESLFIGAEPEGGAPGGAPYGPAYLTGLVEEVRIYDDALTLPEIEDLPIFSWSFTTEDATAPVIANWSPTGTNIPVDEDIYFEVTDASPGSGVDLTTLDVSIHGVPAVVNGVAQPLYSLATVPMAGGYEVTVGHPDLDPLEIINVGVSIEDVAGNPASEAWSYTTADTIAPQVTIITPTDTETGVSVLTNVVFEITDVGAGVDLANTTVTIGGVLAYDGSAGGFQIGYDGDDSAVAVIAGGYRITIDKEDPYVGLSWYTVHVESQDLQAPPNPMTPVEWSFETEFVDLSAPIISNRDPAPDDTNVPVDTTIAFRLTDVSGVDPNSVNVLLGGEQAVVNGVEAGDYSLSTTPVVDGYDYVITPGTNLLLEEEYGLVVTAADVEGNSAAWDWVFTTVDGIVESPRLYARAQGQTIRCLWTLPPPEEMRQTLYELRRSLTAYPTTPDEGDLVYSGLDHEYLDVDVEYGVTYFYTIFVVREYVDGVPLYVDYEDQASARARPRQISVTVTKRVEYVPARGDFGPRTVNPLPHGQVVATWGQKTASGNRQSDLIRTQAGRPVQSPVRGTVIKVVDSDIESSDTRLKRLEIQTVSGITLSLDGIVPWPDLGAGTDVETGQTLGRTAAGNVEFAIWKSPVGAFGRRAIRPRYFYLTTENRDGRL